MGKIEIIMPKMGESVAEATIIKWVKNIGDNIEVDETIVEIATDKVDSEIPSVAKGILKEKLYQENDVVKVGEVIAIIEDKNSLDASKNISSKPKPEKVIDEKNIKLKSKEDLTPDADKNQIIKTQTSINNLKIKKSVETEGEKFWRELQDKEPLLATKMQKDKTNTHIINLFLSPLVKNIIKKEKISQLELENITGTGKNERITKRDLLKYIEKRTLNQEKQDFKNQNQQNTSTHFIEKDVEIIEMDRMRKLIAKHMIESKSTSAHVTSFAEADVSKVVEWRNKIKQKFIERENQKITYTPIIFESIIRAILDFPLINISVDGNNIIKHKNINLGMATALPSGNLIVPVIKKAQEKNILGLTNAVNDLAQRARENKLQPDEINGGTFTVTNVGSFGSVMGTPIINQPQVAILALGKIQKKPTVIETEFGDTIGIRSKMFLSLSYDHRVVDGALGGQFLKRIIHYLESFDSSKEI